MKLMISVESMLNKIMKYECHNDSRYLYSGKESSPLGLGFAPDPYVLGHIMEGRDKTKWVVTSKNSIKVWSRITQLSDTKETQETVAKVVPRKKTTKTLQETKPSDTLPEPPSPSPSPPKRKPTNYNIYMKYKLKQLAKEETHLKPNERIARAVAIWKALTPAEMKDVMEKAKAALENGET